MSGKANALLAFAVLSLISGCCCPRSAPDEGASLEQTTESESAPAESSVTTGS